jgi:hypothetical protein
VTTKALWTICVVLNLVSLIITIVYLAKTNEWWYVPGLAACAYTLVASRVAGVK